jgi:acetylglutamate kinase
MSIKYVVVKIGGRPATNPETLDALLTDLAATTQLGYRPVLVHGGGADITELARKLGLEPQFVNGKRLTSPAEMDIVDAVLGGQVNTRLLRRAVAIGIKAVGLSGVDAGLCLGVPANPDTDSRTGQITQTDPAVIALLAGAGILPVVSSLSSTAAGLGLNINADDAAMEIAKSLAAAALVFISDIPGVLKDGQVIKRITPPVATAEIAAGVISGGMIPKIQGAIEALEAGIGSVIIGDYHQTGDLQGFLAGNRGTIICK